MAVLVGTVEAFATAETVQTLNVSAQSTVSIEKTVSTEQGEVNPEFGTHAGLGATYKVETNIAQSETENCQFIIASKIKIDGGTEVSAFSTDGSSILFGRADNEDYFPTNAAVENAKVGGTNNANVIAYPITITASPMSINYSANQQAEEGNVGCFVVDVNGANEATLQQTISGTPVVGTYSMQDTAGKYQVYVYFTAINK